MAGSRSPSVCDKFFMACWRTRSPQTLSTHSRVLKVCFALYRDPQLQLKTVNLYFQLTHTQRFHTQRFLPPRFYLAITLKPASGQTTSNLNSARCNVHVKLPVLPQRAWMHTLSLNDTAAGHARGPRVRGVWKKSALATSRFYTRGHGEPGENWRDTVPFLIEVKRWERNFCFERAAWPAWRSNVVKSRSDVTCFHHSMGATLLLASWKAASLLLPTLKPLQQQS